MTNQEKANQIRVYLGRINELISELHGDGFVVDIDSFKTTTWNANGGIISESSIREPFSRVYSAKITKKAFESL